MNESRVVTVEQIGTTERSDNKVFRAECGDSWMDFLFPTDKDEDIWVHMVESAEHGGMKAMFDYICQEYDCESIRFCTPLNETLENRLNGFEHESEIVDDPGSPFHGDRFESLVGTWEVNE